MKHRSSHWFACISYSALVRAILTTVMLSTAMLAALLPVPSAAAQATSRFMPVDCAAFPLPGEAHPDERWVCGYLTVPAEHAKPDGPTIRLAVVILKATGQSPQPEPLIMAQGGPGGSTIDTYASLLSAHPLRQARDIVLFDQRGTLYSQPVLYCKEIDDLTIRTLDQDLTPEESERLNLEAMTACHQRLTQQGINLSAFDSLENAADIEALRQALDYQQINLYGVSYGTLLALHYMRLYPGSLRSVILDGVVPPQTNFILTVAKTEDQSFTRLFSTCQADPVCNKEYPNLEQVFFDLVDQLNKTPARITVTDMDTQKSYPGTVIDGDTFQWLTFQMLYVSSLVPALPRIIYDAKQGNFDVASRILAILLFDHSTSYGMYYSVICAEDADFSPQDQDLSGVRPQVAKMEERGPQEILDTCKAWNVEPLASQVDDPVQSDVPTLLLSGAFDPITPAANAETVAATLSHSYSFVFPTGGHGQLVGDKCADGIAQAFLNNPTRQPDAACIQESPAPAFYTSRTVIEMPSLLRILNLDWAASLPFLVLILGALFLLTAFLVFPIAWLVNQAQAKPSHLPAAPAPYPSSAIDLGSGLPADWDNPSPAWQPEKPAPPSIWRRISSWVALQQSMLLPIFLTALTVVIVQMVNNNDNRFFYGLAGEARPWFILPVLFALLSLLMLVIMVMLWARHEGSIGRRLYYSLLALTALVCTIALASSGMLTGLF